MEVTCGRASHPDSAAAGISPGVDGQPMELEPKMYVETEAEGHWRTIERVTLKHIESLLGDDSPIAVALLEGLEAKLQVARHRVSMSKPAGERARALKRACSTRARRCERAVEHVDASRARESAGCPRIGYDRSGAGAM